MLNNKTLISLKLRFSFTQKTQDFSVQHPGSLSISFTGKKLKDLLTRKKFPVSPPNVHQEKFTSKKKKMENSFPEGSSLRTHHEKLFITQKETRTGHLSLFARKTRTRARMKKCAKGRKFYICTNYFLVTIGVQKIDPHVLTPVFAFISMSSVFPNWTNTFNSY